LQWPAVEKIAVNVEAADVKLGQKLSWSARKFPNTYDKRHESVSIYVQIPGGPRVFIATVLRGMPRLLLAYERLVLGGEVKSSGKPIVYHDVTALLPAGLHVRRCLPAVVQDAAV
jgi:hypothetical protein